jgi:hypothetical protein
MICVVFRLGMLEVGVGSKGNLSRLDMCGGRAYMCVFVLCILYL